MNDRPSRVRRSLRASALDGTLCAVMVGFAEIYFAPLALFLGASPFEVGLLTTVPILAGSAFQLPATRVAHWLGDKHWVVGSAVLQALLMFPIALLAWTRWQGFGALLPLVCLYWMLMLGLSPAWNAWMGRMIPPAVRSRFLGRRNIPIQSLFFLSVVAAGLLLHGAEHTRWGAGAGFALCFVIAALARAGSAHFLSRQHDPGKGIERQAPPLRSVVGEARQRPYGKLILLLVLLIFCVNFSAAYFTPYFLQYLKLSYAQFTVLTGVAVIARVVSSPYWAEIARNYGNHRALQVATVLVIPLSSLWTLSHNFAYMILLQILAGFAWGGYELTYVLTLFDCTDDKNRAQVLSLYNLLNGIAIVTGSLIGGAFLRWTGDIGYHPLFIASSIGRALTVFFLARGIGVRRRAREQPFSDVFVRVITLRPGPGEG